VVPRPSTTTCAVVTSPAPDAAAGQEEVGQARHDDDEVVEHRRPHRRAEPAAGVERGAHHRAGAVEQHLRQEVPREHDGEVALGLGHRVGQVEVDDERRGDHQQHRGAAEGQHHEGEQPLRVRGPAVGVVLGGADEQRHDDGGEHAAQQQLVDDVGRGVGDVVGQRQALHAQHGPDDGGAQEAGQPRRHGADRHRPDRPAEAALVVGHAVFPFMGLAVTGRPASRRPRTPAPHGG
jgi:hypothetical protein